MIKIDYPIQGPWRLDLFILEWVICTLFFQWGIIFLYRYLNKKENLESLQERAFSSLCFGFCIQYAFFIFADYTVEIMYFRSLTLDIAYIIGMIFVMNFFHKMEKYKNFLGKYIFTRVYLGLTIISVILMIFIMEYAIEIVRYFFWIPILIFFVIYIEFLFKNRKLLQYKKSPINIILYFIAGLTSFVIGLLLTMDYIVHLFGLGSRFLGSIFMIMGIIFFAAYFLSIPTLSEYDLVDKIEEIFILLKSGICIYYKNFLSEESEELSLKQPMAGGLKSLEIVLSQITDSTGDSVLHSKNKYMIIKPREFITGVIVSKADLYSIRFLLEILLRKIEIIYLPIFAKMKFSDTKIFKPIEGIVRETLSI